MATSTHGYSCSAPRWPVRHRRSAESRAEPPEGCSR
jgi:hypothetical protein